MAAPLYLLDTNILIYARKGMASVLQRIHELGQEQLAVPALVAAELAYGVEKSAQRQRNRAVLDAMLGQFVVLPWTQQAMWHYAQHYHRLRSSGHLIGHIDLLIAAQALALDAFLVTNNTRELERVSGLKLENWAA